MLSKINNNSVNYMKIAISLAKERIGLTGSNPSVGCVVVKDNEIISFTRYEVGEGIEKKSEDFAQEVYNQIS